MTPELYLLAVADCIKRDMRQWLGSFEKDNVLAQDNLAAIDRYILTFLQVVPMVLEMCRLKGLTPEEARGVFTPSFISTLIDFILEREKDEGTMKRAKVP
jgi:hypothetical protein